MTAAGAASAFDAVKLAPRRSSTHIGGSRTRTAPAPMQPTIAPEMVADSLNFVCDRTRSEQSGQNGHTSRRPASCRKHDCGGRRDTWRMMARRGLRLDIDIERQLDGGGATAKFGQSRSDRPRNDQRAASAMRQRRPLKFFQP